MATTLLDLPSEVLLRIFRYLDIPTLHHLTLTSHELRILACDPLLHSQRLRQTPHLLVHALSHRPQRSTISPPHASIWLSRTHVLSRSISKSLVRIRLNHTLSRRPDPLLLVQRSILLRYCGRGYESPVAPGLVQSVQSVERHHLREQVRRKLERRPSLRSLVERNVLPEECGRVSPVLVATRRRVMRESLKDGLRRWVEGRAVAAQRESELEERERERVSVRGIVRKFQAKKAREEEASERQRMTNSSAPEKKRAPARWGSEWSREHEREKRRGICLQPTRAHVLGLKRFWEGVIRAATG